MGQLYIARFPDDQFLTPTNKDNLEPGDTILRPRWDIIAYGQGANVHKSTGEITLRLAVDPSTRDAAFEFTQFPSHFFHFRVYDREIIG